MRRWFQLLCLLVAGWLLPVAALAEGFSADSPCPLADICEARHGSVVRVVGFFHREDGTLGSRMGSGFFVRADGYIATTAGAVADAHEILVEFGDSSYGAELLGEDLLTNVAILRINDPDFQRESCPELFFEPLPLPPVATPVFALACEVGFDPSPVPGLALGSYIRYGNHFFPTRHLRSSIPSNGGAPGAPVFDPTGRFVGMLMASIPAVNGSFILPARAFHRVLCDLLLHGSVRYAYAGIHTQMGRDGEGNYSVSIDRLDEQSPAEHAQLRRGDRILSLNELPLRSLADLHDAIFFASPESPVSMKIQRGTEVFRVVLRTTSRSTGVSAKKEQPPGKKDFPLP
jgi:S1-C subfamily serine protease